MNLRRNRREIYSSGSSLDPITEDPLFSNPSSKQSLFHPQIKQQQEQVTSSPDIEKRVNYMIGRIGGVTSVLQWRCDKCPEEDFVEGGIYGPVRDISKRRMKRTVDDLPESINSGPLHISVAIRVASHMIRLSFCYFNLLYELA